MCPELRPRRTECSEHPGKRGHRRVAFAALDASHVRAMYVCAFPEGFLRNPRPVAECAQSPPHCQSDPFIATHNRTLSGCIL